jgi:3-oxoadipate enol-lactonase
MTSHTIELSSTALHVRLSGDGPPILFVHGFPLDGRMWDAQVAEFSRSFQTIVPDLRGFGASAAVGSGEAVSMERYADDLDELLDRLDIEEPVWFCGLSMGGYIAWPFWQKFRKRLRGLVLCDTRAGADSDEARANREKTARLVEERGNEPLAELMSSKLFSPRTSGEVLSRFREMILDASTTGIAAASRGMGTRPDVSDWLEQIDLPCLVVVGEDDTLTPPEEMQSLAAAISGSHFVTIPSAGHMSPAENPAAFNAALGEFLARPE